MSEPSTLKAADLQRIGVSKPYAHQLVGGIRSPSLRLALKIQAEFGIPVGAWPLTSSANVDRTASAGAGAKAEIVQ